ncbi:hypothetical protein ACWGPL_32295, partial [Streptomyces platensis]
MSSSTTARTARRRTLRLAAATLVAAAGLTLTACSGSNAADAKSAGHTNSAAAESSASGWSGLQSTDSKAEVKASVASKQSGSAHVANGGKAASTSRTQRLADGISTAEITKLGDQHYRAKIVARGSVLATLETKGHDDGLDANDMFVTLT